MIIKNAILISSIGRTGTEFFSKFFADIIPGCTSLHEPDIIKNPYLEKDTGNYLKQIQYAGLWRLIFLKLFRKWTIVNISNARFLGKINFEQSKNELYDQRNSFVTRLPGKIYVEANLGYYGLFDIIPAVFECFRAIYIIRDGRDWVRSTFNWGEVYGKKGISKLLGHAWPTALEIKDNPYSARWSKLTNFEKLCWAWSHLNKYAMNTISSNSNTRLFKFENIFKGKYRYETLDDLVKFATSLADIPSESIKETDGWLEQKIHQSAGQLQSWDHWTDDQKSQFKSICGPLMEELGYKF